METTPRTTELRELAQRIAGAVPREVSDEIVLTGSVSRGVADELSDIEMLVVTNDQLSREQCFALAGPMGLTQLDSWGAQGGPAHRVFGYREGVPIETIWWPRDFAESSVDAIFRGELGGSADALAHGVALRTAGLLGEWQQRLAVYPDEIAATRIEDAALTWGGFAPEGLLTVVRPGERLALVEYMVDNAARVMRIVFALNRVWQPTHKRLAARSADLAVKPDRVAERIEHALTERDPVEALLALTRLQLETVELAPDGPNIVRARRWLAEGVAVLEAARRD